MNGKLIIKYKGRYGNHLFMYIIARLYADKYKINCLKCPKGRYNDLQGIFYLDDCKYCDTGKFSNISGAINPDFCISCDIGKYSTEYGLYNENLCINSLAAKRTAL